jgi:hypothetical protein
MARRVERNTRMKSFDLPLSLSVFLTLKSGIGLLGIRGSYSREVWKGGFGQWMDEETVYYIWLIDSISVGVGELTVRLGECEAFSHVPGERVSRANLKVLQGQLR